MNYLCLVSFGTLNLSRRCAPWSLYVICFVLLVGVTGALRCWNCIADDCHEDPSSNYKASRTECQPGHHCQKVYFEMYSPTDKRAYSSTVRSCSDNCTPQNDFVNCTEELKTTRGCIKKTCCGNGDLCNAAPYMRPYLSFERMITIGTVAMVIFNMNTNIT